MAEGLGEIVWFDLPTHDIKNSQAFYGELFGWKFREMEGSQGQYFIIETSGEQTIGGLVKSEKANKDLRGAPIFYIKVEELDNSLSRAEKMGAIIVKPKTMINEEDGCFAHIQDDCNNIIGLYALK